MIKNCEFCKIEFNAKRKNARFCSTKCQVNSKAEEKICVICGNSFITKYDAKTCSKECMLEERKRTNIRIYGGTAPAKNPEVKKKMEETSIARYGFKVPAQSKEIQEKMAKTNEERYGGHFMKNKEMVERYKETLMNKLGVKNVGQLESVKAKISKTNIERYGNRCSLHSEEVRKKTQETNIERYGSIFPTRNEGVKNKTKMTNIERYGVESILQKQIKNYHNWNREFAINNFTNSEGVVTFEDRIRFWKYFGISHFSNALRKLQEWNIPCELSFNSSLQEKMVINTLKNMFLELEFVENNRDIIINPNTNKFLEIDILIKKEDKIICGVEYNGIYWHDKENPVKEELKSKLCEEKGFPLFHIWEDSVENDLGTVVDFLNSSLSNF